MTLSNQITARSGYAPINGLEMYYEIYGAGESLVLLHGGVGTIDDFRHMLPALAANRQVIAIEQQGHGRTADIDRDLTFDQMTADTAALLEYLGVSRANVFGYSNGGNIALGLAIRHPNLARKIAVAGTNYNLEGMKPQFLEMMANATADKMPDSLREHYASVAPRPEDWPVLIEKLMKLGTEFPGWSQAEVQSITAPTLVITADADIIRLEHAVELFQILPNAHLAVLPMTDHSMRLEQPDWLVSMITEFLDKPEVPAD